jgi:hypothetical protein
MAAKSNHRFRSRGGPKTHVAQLQQGLTKFGVKSAIWIVATASSRVAFDLAATPESADKALNYMNKSRALVFVPQCSVFCARGLAARLKLPAALG